MSIPRFWRKTKERYNLIGTRCKNCRSTFFPPRKICPVCRRTGKLEEVKLGSKGEVVTYTVIRSASEGFEMQTPYIMGIVRLEEGPMMTAQIVDIELEKVKIGTKVEATFRKISEGGKEGTINYGCKFRPVGKA